MRALEIVGSIIGGRKRSRTTALNAENAKDAENDGRQTTGTADVSCREKNSTLPLSASFAFSALDEVAVP